MLYTSRRMSGLVDRIGYAPVAARIVAAWNEAASRFNPIAVIVVVWALLTIPLLFFRGYFAHEGLAVAIAQHVVETGDWLTPYLYNIRFVERPTLQSWIIAAIGEPFGTVNQVTARLPSILFLLFGCLTIYALLRALAVRIGARLFGVALFMACPLVIRSYAMVTADLPLAVLLFLAFTLWWTAYSRGRLGLGRWVAIGVVLALAGLLKGPQPIAYFALGIGGFVLATRSWRQIPGLVLAGAICVAPLAAWYAAVYEPGDSHTWAIFMRFELQDIFAGPIEAIGRLIAAALPAAVMTVIFFLTYRRREPAAAPAAFVGALSCYAFIAPLLILLWPSGSATRYFLPMVPALCVFGALAYEQLSARRPEIVAPVVVLTAGLLLYAFGYAAASPFWPEQFRQAELDGARVNALLQASPAPLYWYGDVATNVLPYVRGKISGATSLDELAAVPGPAWIVAANPDAATLLARRPDKLHTAAPLGEADQWRLLHLDQ